MPAQDSTIGIYDCLCCDNTALLWLLALGCMYCLTDNEEQTKDRACRRPSHRTTIVPSTFTILHAAAVARQVRCASVVSVFWTPARLFLHKASSRWQLVLSVPQVLGSRGLQPLASRALGSQRHDLHVHHSLHDTRVCLGLGVTPKVNLECIAATVHDQTMHDTGSGVAHWQTCPCSDID